MCLSLQHIQLHHSEWSVFVRVVPLLACNTRARVSIYSRKQEWRCILRSSLKHPEIAGWQWLEYREYSWNKARVPLQVTKQCPHTKSGRSCMAFSSQTAGKITFHKHQAVKSRERQWTKHWIIPCHLTWRTSERLPACNHYSTHISCLLTVGALLCKYH